MPSVLVFRAAGHPAHRQDLPRVPLRGCQHFASERIEIKRLQPVHARGHVEQAERFRPRQRLQRDLLTGVPKELAQVAQAIARCRGDDQTNSRDVIDLLQEAVHPRIGVGNIVQNQASGQSAKRIQHGGFEGDAGSRCGRSQSGRRGMTAARPVRPEADAAPLALRHRRRAAARLRATPGGVSSCRCPSGREQGRTSGREERP